MSRNRRKAAFSPRFNSVKIIAADPLLSELAMRCSAFPAIGRRLVQQDPLNPDAFEGPSNEGSSLVRPSYRDHVFIGGVSALDPYNEATTTFGVELRVSRLQSPEPIWFSVRNGDARDLRGRLQFGTIAGFVVRIRVQPDGSQPAYDASMQRGYFVPHGVVYVP